jgi:Tfp pilus assembly PilM family ATPase
VESHNHLGIYLRQDRATVVCVAAQGRDRKLLGCFSVSVEPSQEQGQQALAEQIARTCSERGLKFGQAAVALDCAIFMQHAVHSEFTDPRRIAATVRFDTEEALATDVADVAVAFRIVSSEDSGSNLDVFTAQRNLLSEILIALQGAGIDPVTVDPDSYCLSRYLGVYGASGEASEHRPLYALLSDARGYLLTVPKASEASTIRAFPISEAQNRESLLAREVLITTALAEAAGPVDQLCLFDANDAVSAEQLAQRVGRQVKVCDLAAMAGAGSDDIAGCSNAVDLAIAYGAALAFAEKDKSINFRNDHMPYQGTKLRTNRALKFLSIAATILLLALGVHFQAQWMHVSKTRADIRAKFAPDYVAVMPGKAKLPPTIKKAVNDLEKEVTRLMAEKGIKGTPQESISAKLTLALQALNSCAAQTGLVIDTISVTMKTIHINGSTNSRRSTDSLLEAMKNAGLIDQGTRVGADGERDNFDTTRSVGPQRPSEKS